MSTLLGIEIGGTKLQLGIGPGDGTMNRLVRRRVDPAGGAEAIRAQIAEAFRSLDAEVSAVGIGFGGPVDADRGVVITSHQIAGWDHFPLADWVREALGVPRVAIQNDADTAALGEARFGAGRGVSPVLYVNSGSGIGGGLILDGKIYRGSGAGAVEIGHLWLEEPDPARPGDHRVRTLEQIASGWGIASVAREWASRVSIDGAEADRAFLLAGQEPGEITTEIVAQAARLYPRGEAARILGTAALAMGRALAFAVTLLAPRRIILGGGVALIEDALWLEPIRHALDERVFPPFRGAYDVVPAALGEDVVVHGALALARDVPVN